MKINDLHFDHDTAGFFKASLLGRSFTTETPETLAEIRRLIRRAKDQTELGALIADSPALQGTSIRAEYIRHEMPERVWKEIRAAIGDSCVKTVSDAGGVKIGSDSMSLIVPNGRGDGTTRVGVIDDRNRIEDWTPAMTFFSSIDGSFSIYSYDCGGEPVKTLVGRYGIFFYDGIVIFEKWSEAHDDQR